MKIKIILIKIKIKIILFKNAPNCEWGVTNIYNNGKIFCSFFILQKYKKFKLILLINVLLIFYLFILIKNQY